MPRRRPPFSFPHVASVLLFLSLSGAQGFSDLKAAEPVVPAPPANSEPVQVMAPVRVTSERVSAVDAEGPEKLDRYDPEQIFDSGAFNVNEFIEQLPPSNNGGEVLVLIDGQPAYLDPASLPLGMIEGIDVSREGSMPEHGAYANGQVINIRLKKNYRDAEFGARVRDTFAGGGAQENVRFSGGAARGKLRLLFSIEQTETHLLASTQRDFSREQDHTALGGRDLRLAWGYPAVVQSVSGPLNGVTDAAGNPVSVALVPEHQNGVALTPGQFLPPAQTETTGASGQRRFNTAAYRALVAPAHGTVGSLNLNYSLSPRLQLALTGSFSDTRSERLGPPPVTSASSKTIVPAAFNPFGQDVEVGLVHVEFGPTRQAAHTSNRQFGLKLNGRLGETWSWNTGIVQRNRETRQATVDLDRDKFSAALAATDPAARFNPFGDAREYAVNTSLYPALTVVRTREDIQRDSELDLAASGQVTQLPGGPLSLSLRANYSDRQQERVSINPSSSSDVNSSRQRTSGTLSTALTAPFIGARNAKPLIRRLEASLSARYSAQDEEGAGIDESAGLVWSPAKSLLLRAKYSTNSNQSRPTILPRSDVLTGTLIDPIRNDPAVSNVLVFSRDSIATVPSKSDRSSVGATFEPLFLKGLRLSATYDVRSRRNILQRDFRAQEIINNEAAFPSRVLRAAPTAEDLARGLPGAITGVDVTPGNLGEAESRSLDYSLDYRVNAKNFGRLRFTASAQQFLDSTHEIAPGIPYVHEGAGDDNPPDWTFQGVAAWNRSNWNASLRLRYTSSLPASAGNLFGVAAIEAVDLNVGYRLSHPLWNKFGRGTRLVARIENLFDQDPPFADTVAGFRGGSALGRTLSLAVTVPLL